MLRKSLVAFVGCLALALLAPAFAHAQVAQPVGQELPGYVALESARDYEARARYPESSRALAVGEVDPIRAKRVPAPHSLKTPDVDGLLTVWSSKVSFEAGEPVVLHVAVTDLPNEVIAKTRITGEVVDSDGHVLGKVVYRDRGWLDEETGDGVFSGFFRFPVARVPELAESFLVKVRAEKPNGDVLKAASGFLYSNPHARLTGRYSEELADGNLVISAEVEVDRPGRFHLAGTLYDVTGRPVGWAQAARHLEPGTHTIPLSYFGLMFHETGAHGPFVLGSVALSTTSGMPNALNELAESPYRTRVYGLESFRAQPYGDAALLDAAQRLRTEAFFSRLQASP